MLSLLSPAKKLLDYDVPYSDPTTTPLFKAEAEQLISILRQKSESEIARLMRLSPALAKLNRARYQAFKEGRVPETGSYPALYFFQGDVYQALDAKSLSQESLDFAQSHLAIVSGLYGLLRPFDRIQPYRLEMGTRLPNPAGKTLYDFWADRLASLLTDLLESHREPVLINLASNEYFKAIEVGQLKVPIVHVHFKEVKNGQQKVIGIHAKKARGLMARFILENQVDTMASLKNFKENGYVLDSAQSDAANLFFLRNSL